MHGNKQTGGKHTSVMHAPKTAPSYEGLTGNQTVQRMLQLQKLVGNQVVQRMLDARRPTHSASVSTASPPVSSVSSAPIQRMEDPDGSIEAMLKAMYNKIYMKYGKSFTLPKPSDRTLVRKMRGCILQAFTLDEARNELVDYIVKNTDLRHFSSDAQTEWTKTLNDTAVSAHADAAAYEEQKKKELAELATTNADASSSSPSAIVDDGSSDFVRKKARTELKPDEEFLKDQKNLERVQDKLKNKKIRRLIMSASKKAQIGMLRRARKGLDVKAKHNAMSDEQSLGMSDMLMAQQSYTQSGIGDSLLLEKGNDYQVTMSRGGGQEIHQLGPYENNRKGTSVKQVIAKLLKAGLTTRDLSRAIETRDASRISKTHKGALKEKSALGKIRALRHLHAVERDRGPEVALATTMEQRLASLGSTHMSDYATNHPLAPPQATTDLRVARDKAAKKGSKEVDYVPEYIENRAFSGLKRTAEMAFGKPTGDDPSISLVLRQIADLNEDMDLEDESGPGGDVVKSFELSMMSPPYVWPEDRDHENESEYIKMYNELMKKGAKSPLVNIPDNSEQGSPSLFGVPAPVSDILPVKGLPNEMRKEKEDDPEQKSDCFINAVIQLMSGPYADYFDITKHALRENGKRTIQREVHTTMQIVKGLSPQDAAGIRTLRATLLGSGFVERMVGHEDASELMLKLLRLVTDLEGVQLAIPVVPVRHYTLGKDETLADAALSEGCDLQELEALNQLLDTSPIMAATQSTITIHASTNREAGDVNDSVYTEGKSTGALNRGPGMQEVDIGAFNNFHEFMYYTFGDGAVGTQLEAGEELKVVDDGQPKLVSEFFEQYRMVKLPDVMTFILKRFKQTEFGPQKDNKSFDMPKQLTMIEHSSAGKTYKEYKLVGVAHHWGGVDGGHYTADVEHADKWYNANDETVSEQDDVSGLDSGYMYTYILQSESQDSVPTFQETNPNPVKQEDSL